MGSPGCSGSNSGWVGSCPVGHPSFESPFPKLFKVNGAPHAGVTLNLHQTNRCPIEGHRTPPPRRRRHNLLYRGRRHKFCDIVYALYTQPQNLCRRLTTKLMSSPSQGVPVGPNGTPSAPMQWPIDPTMWGTVGNLGKRAFKRARSHGITLRRPRVMP